MSRDWREHELVKQYLLNVCRQIKAKEVHADIKLEITSHLEELIEDKLMKGSTEQEAVSQALEQMGNPVQVGKQLHAAHRPVWEWSITAIVAILIGIGLLAMYAMPLALGDTYGAGVNWFRNQLIYAAVGVMLLIGFSLINYRSFLKYSWLLYGFTIALMLITLKMGITINGASRWLMIGSVGLDIYALSVYLLLISLAGALAAGSKKPTPLKEWFGIGKIALLFLLIPGFLYVIQMRMLDFVVYVLGMTMILLFAFKAYKLLLSCVVSLIFGALLLFWAAPNVTMYISYRLQGFLYAYSDPSGTGYMTNATLESIRSAGMWGQGLGVTNSQLPFIHSEMVFTYLIFSLGWVFGMGLALLILMLVGRVASAVRRLHEPYGKGIVIGVFSIIGIQLLGNMLMSVGILPIIGLTLPFVSYGGSHIVLELMAMGLVLSVYRRKNMISHTSVESV